MSRMVMLDEGDGDSLFFYLNFDRIIKQGFGVSFHL